MKNNNKQTVVVNLFAGPGTGKSTMASHIFAKLKWSGVDCELIGEYAKQLVWEGSIPKMSNQLYILAKQHNKQWMLGGKVDVIVTDSPILLGPYYDQGRTPHLMDLTLSEFHKFHNINIFLKRKKKYNPNGRMQTLEGAKEIDSHIKAMLDAYQIPYTEIDATEANVETVLGMVHTTLKKLRSKAKRLQKKAEPAKTTVNKTTAKKGKK